MVLEDFHHPIGLCHTDIIPSLIKLVMPVHVLSHSVPEQPYHMVYLYLSALESTASSVSSNALNNSSSSSSRVHHITLNSVHEEQYKF